MKIIRALKYYGYIQFAPCTCDYPQPGSKVLVSIGKNELNVRITSYESDQEEIGFKVTRMRCWRITTLQDVRFQFFQEPIESKNFTTTHCTKIIIFYRGTINMKTAMNAAWSYLLNI